MLPRREHPPVTRSAGRGRGRSQHHHQEAVNEESTISTFRAAPVTEQVESPHPPPLPPPIGIPAMSFEAAQALAAFFTAMVGQAQTGQVQPTVSPTTLSIPPSVPDVSISKKLKEARQLGCVSFAGELDVTIAKDWINQVSETLSDMRLDDEMKLMVATRLLDKRARTWWSSVKSRSVTLLTWSDFIREFDGQYFTHFHQKEKKREFLNLKQENLTVEEYEARFNELMLYVPELVRTEQDQASYFEEGLRNEIKERMMVTGREPHKEVVQMALRAEKLANENRRMRAEFAKRKNPNIFSNQPPKRGRDSSAFGNTAFVLMTSPRPSLSRSQQRPQRFSRFAMSGSGKSSKGFDGCKNCGKTHFGQCRKPVQCFQCGHWGHIRSDCPQFRRATVVTPSPPARIDIQGRDLAGPQQRQGVSIQYGVESNTPAHPPPRAPVRTPTKVFIVTEEETRVRPNAMTGGESFDKGKEIALEDH